MTILFVMLDALTLVQLHAMPSDLLELATFVSTL